MKPQHNRFSTGWKLFWRELSGNPPWTGRSAGFYLGALTWIVCLIVVKEILTKIAE